MLITREKVQALSQREPARFEVESWGGEVLLRFLTGEDRLDYHDWIKDRSNGSVLRSGVLGMYRLVQITAVDEDGEPLFADDEDGWQTVLSMPAAGISAIGNHAADLNGLSVEADEEKSEPSPN